MAALSGNRVTASRNLGDVREFPVVASDIIYAGSIVMIDSAGYANPAAASFGNNGCVGVAVEKVDNSSGSAGDVDVRVQEGEYLMTGVDTLTQAGVGDLVYAQSDNEISLTQGTNEPVAGRLTEFVSATSGWFKIGVSTD